jgi:hypothetical protein
VFQVIRSNVGYGEISTSGLGYWAYADQIVARRNLDGYRVISAHAPSVVEIQLHEPAMLSGLMNCTAVLVHDNPVGFWVDWNYVGMASGPGDETPEIYLGPGRHELRIVHLGDNNYWRQTVWLLRPTPLQPAPPLAVVTVSQFPEEQCHDRLLLFAATARKQGIRIHAFGTCEPFRGYTDAKILRMREWIRSLPSHYTHVLYCDAVDTGLVASSTEILENFQSLGTPILTGAEASCWPVAHRQEWAQAFPDACGGRNWSQAGNWIGERTAILDALDLMARWYEQMGSEDSTGLGDPWDMRTAWPHRWARDNDQYLWQCLQRQRNLPLTIDSEFAVIANLYAEDSRFDGSGAFAFDQTRLVDKITGHRPCVLHFSGGAHNYFHQWLGRLGAF